jgi:hypothetical protein
MRPFLARNYPDIDADAVVKSVTDDVRGRYG